MNNFVILIVLFITLIHSIVTHPNDKVITTKTTTIGKSGEVSTTARPTISDEAIDKTINDKRYFQRQLKCALGEVPCDAVGRRIKSLVPLILRGSCPQCTDNEQKQIKKVLAYVQLNYPKEWNKMLQQYASG